MKNLLRVFEKDNLDEVVFIGRNKAYGAYVLRNEYSNYLGKALFIGIAFFASLAVIPLIINYFTDKNVNVIHACPPVFDLIPIEPDPVTPQQSVSVPQNIKTVNLTIPTPKRLVRNDHPIPNKKDLDRAAIGPETKDGQKSDIAVAPPIIIGPPTNVPTISVIVPPENPDVIIDPANVDVAADFKGGINAFRQKVGQSFDTSEVSEAGIVSATVTFVVERDGSISNIKIVGTNSDFNKEAERTIKSIKTKWTPAQLNGKSVRSSFRMPISMRIE